MNGAGSGGQLVFAEIFQKRDYGYRNRQNRLNILDEDRLPAK